MRSDAGIVFSVAQDELQRREESLPGAVLDLCARNGQLVVLTSANGAWTLRRREGNDWIAETRSWGCRRAMEARVRRSGDRPGSHDESRPSRRDLRRRRPYAPVSAVQDGYIRREGWTRRLRDRGLFRRSPLRRRAPRRWH